MTRGTKAVLVVAAAYAALLLLGAFVLPLYAGSSLDGSPSTASLVSVNGTWGAVVASLPLVATALVTGLLALALTQRWALVGAWAVVGLFGVFTLLGMMTIGVFLLPAVTALALAAALSCGPSTLGPAVQPTQAPRSQ